MPKPQTDIQRKCKESLPSRVAGKSVKAQIPKTELNYLPPADKPNQEIQLDFAQTKRFGQRRFHQIISIDRFSRLSVFTILTINGLPQMIRTNKGTAFTGKEFRGLCKSLNKKLVYGTQYIHTPTGIVDSG